MSPTTGATISTFEVHFLGFDVDLDELLRRLAPGLALAVRQQPVETRADQHDHVRILQHGRTGRARALWVRVGQQTLAHAHRQEGHAALLDEGTDRIVGLRVSRAFAEDDQGTLGTLEDIERTLDGGRRRDLGRSRVDHLDQRLLSGLGIHDLTEQLGRQIEIDPAGTARHRGADRARQRDADVLRMQHAVGRLTQRLGDRELVHFFVVALLQVDDLTFGRAADQDHRKAVGRGVGQRGEAIEKTRGRYRQADAGLLGQEAGDRGRIAGVLLVTERQHADARRLRHAAEVRDRDARNTIHRLDAVELERIDDEMKAIRQLPLCFGCICTRGGFGLFLGPGFGHVRLPSTAVNQSR